VEEAKLPEHRPQPAHLPHQPRNRFPPRGRIGGDELARLVGQVQQDRTALEQADRLTAGAVGIDDCGDLAVGVEAEEFGRLLVVLRESTRCASYGRPVSSSMIDTFTPLGVGKP
jgi:hypothetical protein